MLNGHGEILFLHRVAPTREQKIHRRRPRLRPYHFDLTLDPPGVHFIGRFQPLEQRFNPPILRSNRCRKNGKPDYREACRNDRFEIESMNDHSKVSVTRRPQYCQPPAAK